MQKECEANQGRDTSWEIEIEDPKRRRKFSVFHILSGWEENYERH
jgi:hypothetical protein